MTERVQYQHAPWVCGGGMHCSEYQERYAPPSRARPSHRKEDPVGITIRGNQQGFDSVARFLMTSPNPGGGSGIRAPSTVVVALDEPVIC